MDVLSAKVSTAPWTDFVEEVGPWIRSRDSSKIQAPLASAETAGDRFWQLAMVCGLEMRL